MFVSLFSVSDIPTDLNATRLSTGLTQISLSWSTVSGATGYEVYYTPANISHTSSLATLNISGLIRGSTYTFYVVSYGPASLPSDNASVILTISKLS